MALASVDDCKILLGLTPAISSRYDVRLAAFLVQAEKRVSQLCRGRTLEQTTYSGYCVSGAGRTTLIVLPRPIISISDIRVDNTRLFPDDTALDITNEISWVQDESGLIYRRASLRWPNQPAGGVIWPIGDMNVRLDMVAGYADDAIPVDLTEAVTIIVADKLTRSIQLEGGGTFSSITQESVPGQSIVMYASELDPTTGIPMQAWNILKHYRG